MMLTCVTYDSVGSFAYRVGLPAKSGVGGGIVAVVPGLLTLAVWSPALDRSGNSHAGTAALELFTTITRLSADRNGDDPAPIADRCRAYCNVQTSVGVRRILVTMAGRAGGKCGHGGYACGAHGSRPSSPVPARRREHRCQTR